MRQRNTAFLRKVANRAVTVGISTLSLCFAILGGRLLDTWETAVNDMRFRWRYQMTANPGLQVEAPLLLLAIDAKTQSKMGRFGGGHWLSRKPYFDQLTLLESRFRPSLLAYDILLQENMGSDDRWAGRITESPSRIEGLIAELSRIAEKPQTMLSHDTLADINMLSFEMGNENMTRRLASVSEGKRFPILFPFYFRGGWVDPQQARVPLWSDDDVVHEDVTNTARRLGSVSRLRDLAIPANDISFPSYSSEQQYGFSPNGQLPARGFLNYVSLGAINVRPDPDGVIRRLPLVLGFNYFNSATREKNHAFVPSFSLMACLLHLGMKFPLKPNALQVCFGQEIVIHTPDKRVLRIPIDERGQLHLNYFAQIQDFPLLNFSALSPSSASATGELEKLGYRFRPLVNGRIVAVGVTSAGTDVGACPLSATTPLVIVHLTAISNILGQNFLSPPTSRQYAGILSIIFVAFTLICLLERSRNLGFVAVLFALLYFVVAYLGVHVNWLILPVVAPLLYVGACAFAVVCYRLFGEERAKSKIRGMFARMVSDQVLAYLEENPESLGLSGRNVEATVFFSDIARFVQISEQLPPEELTQLLNAYLTPATNCILEHGGYLDKYVGDGIMAVWGAPYPDTAHAERACMAAIEQRDLIQRLNVTLSAKYGVTIQVRMGINSGMVTAGNMGSDKKFQYTVMGDVVNLAARMEAANKEFGTDIIIGENTRKLLGPEMIVRTLGRVIPVGRTLSMIVYALEGHKRSITDRRLKVISLYEQALEYFFQRDWKSCLRLLDESLALEHDIPAVILRTRTRDYQMEPPGADWHGEYVQKEKD